MRYAVRALKYLLFLVLLVMAMQWVATLGYPEAADISYWEVLRARLLTTNGAWLGVGILLLSLAYPRFGFMCSRVEGCDIERDELRIENAMTAAGFRLVERRDGVLYYRAEGIVQRLSMMFEDRIEVRSIEGGVEICGLRRAVARIAYRLRGYLHNSRFESDK